jgi:hypothetical protein
VLEEADSGRGTVRSRGDDRYGSPKNAFSSAYSSSRSAALRAVEKNHHSATYEFGGERKLLLPAKPRPMRVPLNAADEAA